jgi:hypothetical protein
MAAHVSSLGVEPLLAEQLLIVASELATKLRATAAVAGRLLLWRAC